MRYQKPVWFKAKFDFSCASVFGVLEQFINKMRFVGIKLGK